jgi:hypothetical protein
MSETIFSFENVGAIQESPAEKRSFSDFPKENSLVFALRRWILLWQNPRAIPESPLHM